MAKKKKWSGRYKKPTDKVLELFSWSLPFDQELIREEIELNTAYAEALAEAGFLKVSEARQVKGKLEKLRAKIETGKLKAGPEVEDIHMLVEEELGEIGKKLHAGRSRNDQVATDERLYLRRMGGAVMAGLRQLRLALLHKAAANTETVLPGYTHLQRAQPITFAYLLVAYCHMLGRDADRVDAAIARCAESPLGAAALAGSSLGLDYEKLAKRLGFRGTAGNLLDAVSDRDFLLEFMSALAIIGMHLSRFAAELVVYSSREFGFVRLAEEHTTGSSIMPQKRNPDAAELVRGKCGRLVGDLVALFTILKGLPSAYNRDLQEDKEQLFDAVETALASLEMMSRIVEGLEVVEERMRAAVLEDQSIMAAEIMERLVEAGLPMRKAHEKVGALVRMLEDEGKGFGDLNAAEWKAFSPLLKGDAKKWLSPLEALKRRKHPGGPNPVMVKKRIEELKKQLS